MEYLHVELCIPPIGKRIISAESKFTHMFKKNNNSINE